MDDAEKQRIQDGLALRSLVTDERAWPALERLIRRTREDATATFARDESLSRKWLKGVIDTLDLILPNIEQMARDAEMTLEREKQLAETSRDGDGSGSGEMAV